RRRRCRRLTSSSSPPPSPTTTSSSSSNAPTWTSTPPPRRRRRRPRSWCWSASPPPPPPPPRRTSSPSSTGASPAWRWSAATTEPCSTSANSARAAKGPPSATGASGSPPTSSSSSAAGRPPRTGSGASDTKNRGRLAEKRTIPLPPSRTPKKEPPALFSHGDNHKEVEKINGHHPHVKQEEDLHISIMKRSQNGDLTSFLSSLNQSRQLGMPETQNRCEFKRSSLEVGLGAADEVLGKRKICVPGSNGDCLLESKKSRSESPKENSHTPLLEGSVTQMTPEEDYRRLMSALNEHSTFEEQQQQQQRLYQLAGGISVPSHSDILRARQEVASRNPSSLEPHLPSASNSASQRRKQGLPQHRDSHFSEREMSHPPPLLSPQNAPHIALGPHLRPPFLGVPSALCQTPVH
ncbi:sterile alpha motif domain-containing protein 11, partial [Pseudonaja textilis]|uniref:sterile alpha motif domain-containing protein 11 n=1 Tax=Pseudonaja textilis TaxID=8673 RepID=UPI000EA98394